MEEFTKYCLENNLEKAKEIYKSNNIDIQTKNKAFINSCYNDNLEFAKWLYSLDGIDKNIIITLFNISCEYGNINILQWLYSLGGINIHINNDFYFSISCRKKHINILKWLCSLTDTHIIINENPIQYKIIKQHILMKQLDNPKQYAIITDSIDDVCMICLEQETYMCKLDCRHIYCCACLKHYLELNKTSCCACRKVIDKYSDIHLIYKKD
jgi:hypothetical protein